MFLNVINENNGKLKEKLKKIHNVFLCLLLLLML